MIVCDTSALSHFFRRSSAPENEVSKTIAKLIELDQIALLGIVRQELLSGIKLPEHFDRTEAATRALPLFLAEEEDHITAARFFNACRASGIQGSPIDFLICAMSVRRKFSIYTTDTDFAHYGQIIPIELYRE